MSEFRSIVNDCIRIGLATNPASLKRLSTLAYTSLKKKNGSVPSSYRVNAVSKAAGILEARKKSKRRGIVAKDPYLKKPVLVSSYGFKISNHDSRFRISKKNKVLRIPLTGYVIEAIQEEKIEVRSFTLTPTNLSISIRKEVTSFEPRCFIGIDRNASNVTCGNEEAATQFDLKKVEEIGKTTRKVVGSFK